MLSQDRVDSLADIAKKVAHLEGEFWDVGCNAGGSAAVMKAAAPNKHIRLFDSFEGLPASTEEDGPHGSSRPVGMFAIEYVDVLQCLGTVHKGWVPETFKGLEGSKISLASNACVSLLAVSPLIKIMRCFNSGRLIAIQM